MSFDVSPGNVEWVATRVAQSLDGGQFNLGEVIMGVAEALGRVVVSASDTPVQAGQCMQVIVSHLNRTMHAGYTARGFNMGELDD